MLKSIERSSLTGTMGIAWSLVNAGERIVAFAESWEVNETNSVRASFVELLVWRVGKSFTALGERLELCVNRLAMGLGYYDGEVSGVLLWPAMSH